MDILIVSHYCPPLNEIASSRVASWVRVLQIMGHSVTVLTTRKYPMDGASNFNFDYRDARVIEVDYLPGQSNDLALANVQSKAPNSFAFRIMRETYFFLKRYFPLSIFSPRQIWLRKVMKRIATPTFARQFDAVVSTYSPAQCHEIANRLKQLNPRLAWIADYRDLWTHSHLHGANPIARHFEHKKEQRLLKLADSVTTVSRAACNQLTETLGREAVYLFENGVNFLEIDNLKPERSPLVKSGKVNVGYTGTFYEQFPPQKMVNAIRSAPSHAPSLHFTFLGNSNELTRRLGRGDDRALSTYPTVPRLDCLTFQRDCDFLLFFAHIEPAAKMNRGGIISGKVFEYIASGTPIICITEDQDSEAATILREYAVVKFISYDDDILHTVVQLIEAGVKPDTSRITQFRKRYDRDAISKHMFQTLLPMANLAESGH